MGSEQMAGDEVGENESRKCQFLPDTIRPSVRNNDRMYLLLIACRILVA